MDQSVNNQSAFTYVRQTARNFLDRETTGGMLLIAATILALILANSQWADLYHHYLKDEFVFEFSVT